MTSNVLFIITNAVEYHLKHFPEGLHSLLSLQESTSFRDHRNPV